MIAVAAVSVAIAMLQTSGTSGTVPAGLGPLQPPGRVVWLPGGPSQDNEQRECTLTTSTRWSCSSVTTGESGVVMILADGLVRFVVLGPTGVAANGTAEWGRLVRIASAGLGGESPGDLRVSAWKVDRPANRPNTLKLDVSPDESRQVFKVSPTSFWISGPVPSADEFLRLDGTGIARHDTTVLTVAEGSGDTPFVIDATIALGISGRVEARSSGAVEGALVELFATAPGIAGINDERSLATAPVIRLSAVSTDADGRFEFSGLDNGPYQVAATSFSHGRLTRWTTTSGPPLLMKLVPPTTVTGTVMRQKLPATDVRVRFVPAATAWRSSSDPSAHLTADTRTDNAGRFTLSLPPEPSGDVQFIAPDGASLRVSLPATPNLSEIALGEITLPELLTVEIRADIGGCRLTAIGPAGALGLAVVTGRGASTIYQFELPEPGQWYLDGECAGRHVSIQPPAILVKPAHSSIYFDVHIVTPDNSSLPR